MEIQFKVGENKLFINGQLITVETPFVENGRTMVPVRVITEAFGAHVSWNGETRTVGLSYNDQSIALPINKASAIVNGKVVQLENAPVIRNGRTMVPLRFISETFGATVQYDAETRQITIVLNVEVPDAYSLYTNDTYGFLHYVPKDWDEPEYKYGYVSQVYSDDENYIATQVSSIKEGDTVEQWVKRDIEHYQLIYAQGYYEGEEFI